MNDDLVTISRELLDRAIRCIAKAEADNAFAGCAAPQIGSRTLEALEAVKAAHKVECEAIAVISIAHLTHLAVSTLAVWQNHGATECAEGPPIWSREHNIMVPCGIDDAAQCDEVGSLVACIDRVAELFPAASYILFDRDADQVDGLPVYDW